MNGTISRRRVPGGAGTAIVAGLAGCSSLPFVGGSEGPKYPDVDRIPPGQMARNWVQSGDEPPRQFSMYSPYQLYQRAGITYTAVVFPGCYHGMSVSPAEIPVTLYQWVNDVTVTVDQSTSFISGEQLATELEDRGAESVAGVDGFELYLRGSEGEDAWRHALSEDRHLAVKGADGIDFLRGRSANAVTGMQT